MSYILKLCDRIDVGGEVVPLEEGDLERIEAQNLEFSRAGLRTLALAYRPVGVKVWMSLRLCGGS